MNAKRRKRFTAALLLLVATGTDAAVLSVRVTDQRSAAVEDAIVYVMPVGGKGPARPPTTVIVDQVDRQFTPPVSVIQTGTSISFPNKDNIRHQVYSFSNAKVFNLKLYSGVPSQPVLFDKPGLVVMGCNIHDQMVAFVQVVDTPWFGKSNRSGVARIEALPAGDYLVYTWHPRLQEQPVAHPLKLAADASIQAVLPLDP